MPENDRENESDVKITNIDLSLEKCWDWGTFSLFYFVYELFLFQATRLVKWYKEDELDDQLCVVVVNIRGLSVHGIESEGILLCAQDDKFGVELISPPPGN